MTGYKWELYNIADDFSENNDLAAKNPDKLKELQGLFMDEARKYQVLPLDNSILERVLAPRPSATAGRTEFTYSGEVSGLPDGNAPNCLSKSYSITADVEIPPKGAEGMLNTLGGRFGGYGLYLLKGKPVFTYNLLALEQFRWEGPQALTPGKHTIVFDFKYDGPGMAKGGTGVLSVDGKEVASKTIPHTVPATLDDRRVLRRRSGYPHGRGRQGLPAAVPLHRQARQADDQTRTEPDDGRGPEGQGRSHRPSERLSERETPDGREPAEHKASE